MRKILDRIDRSVTGKISLIFLTEVETVIGEGTATAGIDYNVTYRILQFSTGETSKVFSIPILNDNKDEKEETFAVRIIGVLPGYWPGNIGVPGKAIVTIYDSINSSRSGTYTNTPYVRN